MGCIKTCQILCWPFHSCNREIFSFFYGVRSHVTWVIRRSENVKNDNLIPFRKEIIGSMVWDVENLFQTPKKLNVGLRKCILKFRKLVNKCKKSTLSDCSKFFFVYYWGSKRPYLVPFSQPFFTVSLPKPISTI